MAPEEMFVLPEDVRNRVRPGFDADALQRFMSLLDSEARSELLPYFLTGSAVSDRVIASIDNDDPAIQEAFAAVWAPAWRAMTPERVADLERQFGSEIDRLPGLRRAMKRETPD